MAAAAMAGPASPAGAATGLTGNPLYHRPGVWGLSTAADARVARALYGPSFNRAAPSTGAAVSTALGGIGYVDPRIQQLISNHLCAGQRRGNCRMTAAQEAALEADVRTYIASARGNRTIAAYYVQDDNLGPTRATLEKVHQIIAAAGGTVKPTVCAFFSPLEYRWGGLTIRNRSYFTNGLSNYTPRGCDTVGIYAYAPPVATSLVDWKMTQMMPYVRLSLRLRGWNPSRSLLVGIPQGFNSPGTFAIASGGTLSAQTAAFCRQGAKSVVPFSWRRMSSGMRLGYAQGVRQCRAVW